MAITTAARAEGACARAVAFSAAGAFTTGRGLASVYADAARAGIGPAAPATARAERGDRGATASASSGRRCATARFTGGGPSGPGARALAEEARRSSKGKSDAKRRAMLAWPLSGSCCVRMQF